MKMRPARRALLACSASLVASSLASQARAQFDAPTSYYSTATGLTGAALKSQLQTITTAMTEVSYGDARFSAEITDANPTTAGNILLIYNRASVSATWDEGATWNREHMWPVSHLTVSGADPGNTTTDLRSDQFNLRPANPVINSTRGNTPYGPDGGGGAAGMRNGDTVWYPGDADAGDVARAQFYMATRYSTLSLVDSITPTGTQMGDLSSLLRYHYKDVPDTFERRRNHAIFGNAGAPGSPAITNPYKQENRNPYVDHPEYAWSVFVDQQNDSTLSVAAPNANGGSTAAVNLGRVLRNAAVPAAQGVTLNKAGVDGTYYSATTSGDATSNVTGRYNAFAMDAAGTRTLVVGLNTTTSAAGLKSGSVVVDNLDITTAGGAGHGANDADDTINVSLSVLDPSNSSFTGGAADTNTLTIDFGSVQPGVDPAAQGFSLFNLASAALGASLTAGLDLDTINATGNTAVFSTDLSSFANLAAGAAHAGTASFDAPLAPGTYGATYTLLFSDENLPGTVTTTSLTLNVTGSVVPEPATLAFAAGAMLFLAARRRRSC